MRPITVSVGPVVAGSANVIALTQTPNKGPLTLNGATVAGGVANLTTPQQLLITTTGNETGKTAVVTGTDASGRVIAETLALPNAGTVASVYNYVTVTSVTISANAAAALTVGTSGIAVSAPVMFDPYVSGGYISKQTVVTGAANYTVQISYDDPNASGGGAMSWLPDTDATFVGATTSLTGSWAFVPLWARVLMNSGAGSVRATFIQPGNLGR